MLLTIVSLLIITIGITFTCYSAVVQKTGNANDIAIRLASHVGVRPVINLKPGSINAGDGTAANPFRIE